MSALTQAASSAFLTVLTQKQTHCVKRVISIETHLSFVIDHRKSFECWMRNMLIKVLPFTAEPYFWLTLIWASRLPRHKTDPCIVLCAGRWPGQCSGGGQNHNLNRLTGCHQNINTSWHLNLKALNLRRETQLKRCDSTVWRTILTIVIFQSRPPWAWAGVS